MTCRRSVTASVPLTGRLVIRARCLATCRGRALVPANVIAQPLQRFRVPLELSFEAVRTGLLLVVDETGNDPALDAEREQADHAQDDERPPASRIEESLGEEDWIQTSPAGVGGARPRRETCCK